jgi:hypothetical protein
MSASTWLQGRADGVPSALAKTLHAGASAGQDGDVSEIMMHAARQQLTRVLSASPMTRAQALELLAADAFATYALEAAADQPESLADRADSAMRLFAEQGLSR